MMQAPPSTSCPKCGSRAWVPSATEDMGLVCLICGCPAELPSPPLRLLQVREPSHRPRLRPREPLASDVALLRDQVLEALAAGPVARGRLYADLRAKRWSVDLDQALLELVDGGQVTVEHRGNRELYALTPQDGQELGSGAAVLSRHGGNGSGPDGGLPGAGVGDGASCRYYGGPVVRILRGAHRRWCGDACRQQAYRERQGQA